VWVIGHTKEKIEQLKKGNPLIYEPGLTELLKKNLEAGRIHFALDYSKSIPESDIVFIAVGTPPKEDGEADISNVISVAEKIAKYLKRSITVVSCKSTVPVGTNKKIESIIQKNKSVSSEFAVASCPEFLREGTGINDTLNPDRIIIGSNSKQAIEMLLELHKPIGGKRIIINLASAELIKYASNAMLATKISYANLISFYCEKTGADVETVLDAVGVDLRIGRKFLFPGVGYGGSCLPKDVKAFIKTGKNAGIDTCFLESVENINTQAYKNMIEKIIKNIKEKIIGIWGLSFKPDTDDIRFAPSIFIIEELLKNNFRIQVYDPEAMKNIKNKFGNKLVYCSTPYEAAKNVSALCILTEWNEFKQIDLKQIKNLMTVPMIFDGRNIYDPNVMKKLGIIYFGVGRNL
jgi:UDPglucose 6-dehydrogenase